MKIGKYKQHLANLSRSQKLIVTIVKHLIEENSTGAFSSVPGMGAVYRVQVPNAEGDVGVSQEQGCRG